MKPKIPFRIRTQYEKWEFELDILETELSLPQDCYLYRGKVKKFLNYLPDETELVFDLDRLSIVILTFLNTNMKTFKELCSKMEELFGKPTVDECFIYKAYVYSNKNKSYYCYPTSENSFKVMYGISVSIPIYYIFCMPCIIRNKK